MYALKRVIRRFVRVIVKPAALAVEFKLSPDLTGPVLSLVIFLISSMGMSWAKFTKTIEIGGTFIWSPTTSLIELSIYILEAASIILVTTMFLAIISRHKDLKTFALCSLYVLIPMSLGRLASIPLIMMTGNIVVDYTTATNTTMSEALFLALNRWGRENWLLVLLINVSANLVPSIWAMLIQSLLAVRILNVKGNAVFLILAAWISIELVLIPIANAAAYGLKIMI